MPDTGSRSRSTGVVVAAQVADREVDAAGGAGVDPGRVDGPADLELEAGRAHEQRRAEEQRGRDDAEGEQLRQPEDPARRRAGRRRRRRRASPAG